MSKKDYIKSAISRYLDENNICFVTYQEFGEKNYFWEQEDEIIDGIAENILNDLFIN